MLIKAFNPDTDGLEKTYLTKSYAAGVTAIEVVNNNLFTNTDPILLGEMGHERSESVAIGGAVTAGNDLTVGATVFAHAQGEPVYLLEFNRVSFYRSTTGKDGAYSLLGVKEVDYDNVDKVTTYEDTSSAPTYYYKYQYSHSVSGETSEFSDPTLGSQYEPAAIGRVITDTAKEVGDPTFEFIDQDEWLSVANECNEDLQTRVKKPYRFLHNNEKISSVASQNYLDLTALTMDVWKYDFILYNNLGSSSDTTNPPYRVLPLEEFLYRFSDTSTAESDELQYVALDEGNNKILLYPTPATSQTDVFTLYAWKKFTRFDSLGDEWETPTSRVYKMFFKAHYYGVKSIKDRAFLNLADRFESKYESEAVRIPRASRLDAGTPKAFKFLPQDNKGFRRH